MTPEAKERLDREPTQPCWLAQELTQLNPVARKAGAKLGEKSKKKEVAP